MDKKLQVFVSSTYREMQAERQAVVEIILKARHIPAGMELFVATDKTQLHVIKQWIRDSDVFMLILGGRYGSIEPDSNTSYTEVEYEFALSINKPLFAVVMHDEYLQEKIKEVGTRAIEQDHPDLLNRFKERVTSKQCTFFKSIPDLKLAVFESLDDIQRNRAAEVVGWVRADNVTDPAPLSAQIGKLEQENQLLRERLANAGAAPAEERYSGYDFAELCGLLNGKGLQVPQKMQEEVKRAFYHPSPSVLQILWTLRSQICAGYGGGSLMDMWLVDALGNTCSIYSLVGISWLETSTGRSLKVLTATEQGKSFLSRLQREEQLRTGELALQGD